MQTLWFHNENSSREDRHLIYIEKRNTRTDSMGPFNIKDATHNYNKVCNHCGPTDIVNCKSTFLVALRYQTGGEY